eukprot:m.136756 g.136756  ORF g.136756 m.136756 type:complete len:83 (+) comp10882_c0_seq1:566-814(+)
MATTPTRAMKKTPTPIQTLDVVEKPPTWVSSPTGKATTQEEAINKRTHKAPKSVFIPRFRIQPPIPILFAFKQKKKPLQPKQ